MRAGAPQESLLRLAAPLILSFWMRSLFTFVDTIYASTLEDGVAAIAAIGLTIPLEFLFIATWTGLSSALTSHLSRAMAQGSDHNFDLLNQTLRRLLYLLIPLFLGAAVALYFIIPHLGLPSNVARNFQIYGPLLFGGQAALGFWSIIPDSIVKAHHDTRSTMMAGILSNLINVALNTVFTFLFHWGIFGIAFSTVLGNFGGLSYALRRAGLLERERRGRPAPPQSSPVELMERPLGLLLKLALPSSAAFLLMASEGALVNFLLSKLPESKAALAAYSIYYRIQMFSLMPVIATGVAMLPFVARYLGQRRPELVRRGYYEALGAAVIYALALVLPVLWLAGGPILRWLTDNDPATIEFGLFAIRLVPWAVLGMGLFALSRPIFEGAQQGRPGLIMALLRYLVLAPPLAYLGLRWIEPPFHGLMLGLLGSSGIVAVAFCVWAYRFLKQLPNQENH